MSSGYRFGLAVKLFVFDRGKQAERGAACADSAAWSASGPRRVPRWLREEGIDSKLTATGGNGPGTGHPMTTVVVIADHGIIRAAIEQFLSGTDDIFVVAALPTAAQYARQARAADVVVLDLAAGAHHDPMTLITALASRSAVVVISGNPGGRDLLPALGAGALALLPRESGPGDLVAAVRAASRGALFAAAGLSDSFIAQLRGASQESAPSEGTGLPLAPGLPGLASREAQTLRLIADGYTHGQIATRMGVTEATVDTYVKRIRRKLNAGNKAELTRMAIGLGYATLSPGVPLPAVAQGLADDGDAGP
jgi:two-component system, NarL family, nitrate/nitrite response regulator NarL